MKVFPIVRPEVEVQTVPIQGHRIVFGLVWQHWGDLMTVAILDATTRELVALDRSNSIGYQKHHERLADLRYTWKPTVVYVELTVQDERSIEALQVAGFPIYPVVVGAMMKERLILDLANALNNDTLKIMDDEILLHELSMYEMEETRLGKFHAFAPTGENANSVEALSLALYGAQYGGISIRFA